MAEIHRLYLRSLAKCWATLGFLQELMRPGVIRPFPPPTVVFFSRRHRRIDTTQRVVGFFCPPTTGIHLKGFGTMAGLVTRKLSPLISQNTPRSAQCAHTLFFFFFFCFFTSTQTHTNALLRNSCALFLGLDADACTQKPVFLSCRARLCMCVWGGRRGGCWKASWWETRVWVFPLRFGLSQCSIRSANSLFQTLWFSFFFYFFPLFCSKM